MSLTQHKSSGFTLIELAIVIAIIGILAGAAVFNFSNNLISAENAKADAIGSALNSGVAMSIANNLIVPANFAAFVGTDASDTIDIPDTDCVVGATVVCDWSYRLATYTLGSDGSVTWVVTDT